MVGQIKETGKGTEVRRSKGKKRKEDSGKTLWICSPGKKF